MTDNETTTSDPAPSPTWEEWLLTCPPAIRVLAEEFPIGVRYIVPALVPLGASETPSTQVLYLIGWGLPDRLIFSTRNPMQDLAGAKNEATHRYVPAETLRGQRPLIAN